MSNEPRECGACGGAGRRPPQKVTREIMRDGWSCPSCNGTGRVWPSMASEQVLVVQAQEIEGVGIYVKMCRDVPFAGDYRIIIQHIRAHQEKEARGDD